MFESVDRWLRDAIYAGGSSAVWIDVVLAFTFLGSGWMLLGLLPIFFVPRMRARAAALLVTLAVTSGVVAAVKMFAGRVRPWQAQAFAHAVPIELPTDPSFPSGHAAGSFAFAAFIGAFNRRAGVALAGLAALIALSRVALGVHYATDVAAGALLGTALGSFGARLATVLAARVTPAIAPANVAAPGPGVDEPAPRQPPSV
jgi:undecaprenyl-diphosphatase